MQLHSNSPFNFKINRYSYVIDLKISKRIYLVMWENIYGTMLVAGYHNLFKPSLADIYEMSI